MGEHTQTHKAHQQIAQLSLAARFVADQHCHPLQRLPVLGRLRSTCELSSSAMCSGSPPLVLLSPSSDSRWHVSQILPCAVTHAAGFTVVWPPSIKTVRSGLSMSPAMTALPLGHSNPVLASPSPATPSSITPRVGSWTMSSPLHNSGLPTLTFLVVTSHS
jgi:hypothetical protein